MALRGQVSCPNLDQMDWERKREEEKERANGRERESMGFEREKLYLLSKIPGDRTVSFRRGKKQSCSPRHTRGYQIWGVSTNSEKVGVFLLLDLLFS